VNSWRVEVEARRKVITDFTKVVSNCQVHLLRSLKIDLDVHNNPSSSRYRLFTVSQLKQLSSPSKEESRLDSRLTSQASEGLHQVVQVPPSSSSSEREAHRSTHTRAPQLGQSDGSNSQSATRSPQPRRASDKTTSSLQDSRSSSTGRNQRSADNPPSSDLALQSQPVRSNSTTPATSNCRRKRIEGDCDICYKPFVGSEDDDYGEGLDEGSKPQADLVWCRRQCGTNFHRDCLDWWISRCRVQTRCPYW